MDNCSKCFSLVTVTVPVGSLFCSCVPFMIPIKPWPSYAIFCTGGIFVGVEKAIEPCRVPLNDGIHSRRCFMTGEYCSQLNNIHKARERLHNRSGEINAFVIMNFSNMSDVAYRWRLRPFIESLTKYLYFEGNKLVCCPEPWKSNDDSTSSRRRVSKINVIRADSNYDSNYVICNRVCQQIQMADLIVVDVSSENNNVFYEFGMAVALGKLILPICFSESFFQISYPPLLEEYFTSKNNDTPGNINHLKRHIDCYPWRRTLFEHYGLRYRSKKDSDILEHAKDHDDQCAIKDNEITQYIHFKDAFDPRYGFSDIQYDQFPYMEPFIEPYTKPHNDKRTIGKKIYTLLRSSYNNARYENNTLIIYTMDGFLNADQAGACIINFYNHMTDQLQEEHCFCGDRVGILAVSSKIPESAKDAKKDRHLLYRVGDIIHLGMNEATYTAQRELIKTDDYLTAPTIGSTASKDELDKILIFTKNHIRNRSITVYPKTPVYVKRITYGLQPNLLDVDAASSLNHYFCYFHVMLRTLKYVNQLVVDISKNSLESLFWLGAAHGGDINAITVQHEESEQERTILTGSPEKRERAIFDVAGLWSALLRSYDTKGFYLQLKLAQKGIEQRSKLMLQDLYQYKKQLENYLYQDSTGSLLMTDEDGSKAPISGLMQQKQDEERLALESYYRDRFWKPLLRNEHLRLYYHQVDGKDSETSDPKVTVGKWDIDAISVLSHYLSVRTHVGEHSFVALQTDRPDKASKTTNFISIGNNAKPIPKHTDEKQGIPLADYILERHKLQNHIHIYIRIPENSKAKVVCTNATDDKSKPIIQFQGFGNASNYIYSQIPSFGCLDCKHLSQDAPETSLTDGAFKVLEKENATLSEASSSGQIRAQFQKLLPSSGEKECQIKSIHSCHLQVAQLVLWRKVNRKIGNVWYQVSMNGASGPATKALSSLVVNDTHRKTVFDALDTQAVQSNSNAKEEANDPAAKNIGPENHKELIPSKPLSQLQEKVRQEFVKKLADALSAELENDKIRTQTCEKLSSDGNPSHVIQKAKNVRIYTEMDYKVPLFIHAALLYLSSVLFRYFLPFLSLEDEHRLINGMRYFLSSFFASHTIQIEPDTSELADNDSERKTIIEAIQAAMIELATKAFTLTLWAFQGVEALYEVTVLSQKSEAATDSRSCVGIRLSQTCNLFVAKEEADGTRSLRTRQNPQPLNLEESPLTQNR